VATKFERDGLPSTSAGTWRFAFIKAHLSRPSRRTGSGAPVLMLNIALHYGEVFYDNFGAAGRLDFTVIGASTVSAN
jgi:adenylate cyclase